MKLTAVVLSLFLAGSAFAQTPALPSGPAHVRFSVENLKFGPPAYSLDIREDGTGSYSASPGGDPPFPTVQRSIQVHNPLLSRLFQAAREHHFFAIDCEAAHDHVAFTGKKTLAYAGPDGAGSCTFNYSHDQSLNQIAADMMAVAATLEFGRRLDSEHLHDRLSLDAELESLQEAVQNRQAIEIGNIASDLESIAGDGAVMNRARARARSLLSEPVSLR
jgi:hypothetical protein